MCRCTGAEDSEMDLFVSYAHENINHEGRHDRVLNSTRLESLSAIDRT